MIPCCTCYACVVWVNAPWGGHQAHPTIPCCMYLACAVRVLPCGGGPTCLPCCTPCMYLTCPSRPYPVRPVGTVRSRLQTRHALFEAVTMPSPRESPARLTNVVALIGVGYGRDLWPVSHHPPSVRRSVAGIAPPPSASRTCGRYHTTHRPQCRPGPRAGWPHLPRYALGVCHHVQPQVYASGRSRH
jgi:hypothetical protein